MRISFSRPLLGLCALLAWSSSNAADLVEPWERGFSNIEFFATHASGENGIHLNAVIGFGVPGSISLGGAASRDADGTTRLGFIGFWTHDFGGGQILDVFAEGGISQLSDSELRTKSDWLAGFEWSLSRKGATPYVRTTFFDAEESGGIHPLIGVMVPTGERVEIHWEVSSEAPESGAWPLHLAFGPNVTLNSKVELIPEISMVHQFEDGETDWQISIGVIIDPRRNQGQAKPSALY